MAAYTPTVWANDNPPPLSAVNLNKLTDELRAQAATKGISHSLPVWVNGAPPALTDASPLNEMESVAQAVAASESLPYTPTSWSGGWTPARNAARFNQLELQAQANRAAMETGGYSPLTANITAGGTYSGTINGSGSATAVTIATAQPVTILNSTITHSSPTGTLVNCVTPGAQIIIRGTTFTGLGAGGKAGRAFYATNWKSILLENNTINGTWGFRINTPQAGATSVRVTKNRFTNQTSDTSGLHCIQFAEWGALTVGAAEIDWNWCVNEFQKSNMEDPISLFKANGVQVHDNMVDGGYPATLTSNYSGTGTVISDFGGDNNNYFNNTVVACINGGVGISGGANNHVYNNRIVSDGRDDAGNEFTRANVGLICYTTTLGNNNTMYGNYVGWMQGSGFGHPISRADLYCPTADNNVGADNSWAYGNHSTPMTKADEDAERTRWAAKIAANGITIGA